ncbi:MAG: TasA family protein [Acutalibacteraceae bacterium]|nr:TasA family protein [Acutalibacteraceae bacterium]
MTKTKKSLLMRAISLLLCISMLIGSTFAWFTDSVTSAGNKIQSGTLKVDLELLDKETGKWNSLKDTKAPIFNYDKWEPGYVDTKVLKVENEGNLALKWVAKFYSEKQLSILADVIDVYVRPSDSEIGYPANRSLEGYTCVGSLKTFINSIEETTQGTLEAKEAAYLGIALKMREEAGNEYQNLSLGGAFDIRIFATQHTSESDSFGNQYDKNSLFEDFVDKSILTSQGKYLNDGADSVNFSIYHKGVKIVAASVPASAIANKDKPVTITIRAIDSYIEAGENTQSFAYDIDVTNLKSNLKGDQLVTVVIAAPKGLASIKAYHKNELLTDAVYDEVEGTITFKTASFSPFAVAADIVTVETFEDLQTAMQNDGANIALGKDIKVESIPRDKKHAYPNSDNPKYYNGIKVKGKNVSLDLNGKGITVSCGQGYNDHDDVGALFFVAEKGSLNINDSVGTGYIKMESSIYAVWAPFNDGESYLDINGGIFIADSYAGDPVGTPVDSQGNYDPVNGTMTNAQEGANRALIYAGHGGNINVYGGYFLYNNTLNDKSNRNNGAFNAKDYYEDGALITIHEGVYLSNESYRQDPYRNLQTNPSYDDYSVVLSQYGEISETTVTETIKIVEDGIEKEITLDWYKVVPNYKYKITFMNADGTEVLDTQYIGKDEGIVYLSDKYEDTSCIDKDAKSKLTGEYVTYFDGWTNAASEKVTEIGANNDKNIVLYPKLADKYTVRWLDEDGNVKATAQTSVNKPKYINVKEFEPTDTASKYDNMKFDHWEVREVGTNGKITYTAISDNYSIAKDITLYPYYVYGGGLGLTPHDEDGDGRPEYYTVEAVGGLNGILTIPGDVNDIPVTTITDLSSDLVNGLFGGGINTIIIEEGVKEIGSKAFAGTAGLNYVEVPTSVTNIGANAFSSSFGVFISKKVTIKYAGTWAEWQAACGGANSDSDWDSGLDDGSKVECSDATYVLETNGLVYDHTWSDWKKQ